MSINKQIETLVGNARRLGHTTQVAALAIELFTGLAVKSACCWCAEIKCEEERFDARRVNGGDCQYCSYTGVDTLVCIERSE